MPDQGNYDFLSEALRESREVIKVIQRDMGELKTSMATIEAQIAQLLADAEERKELKKRLSSLEHSRTWLRAMVAVLSVLTGSGWALALTWFGVHLAVK